MTLLLKGGLNQVIFLFRLLKLSFWLSFLADSSNVACGVMSTFLQGFCICVEMLVEYFAIRCFLSFYILLLMFLGTFLMIDDGCLLYFFI